MLILLYCLLGAVAGLFSGLLGIGGGLIVVPCLLIVFPLVGISPSIHVAVGTSLATIIVTLCSSIRAHLKRSDQQLLWHLGRQFLPGIIMGTLLGAVIAKLLSGAHLAIFFGIIVWLLALRVFLVKNTAHVSDGQSVEQLLPAKRWLLPINILIASLASIMGVGGGGFMITFLQIRKVPMRIAIPIATMMGIPVAIIGTLSYIVLGWSDSSLPHWSTGYVYWPAVFGITIASIFTAPLGAKLAHKLPNELLRWIFVIMLVIIGGKMIFWS
jgi:uncharacterized membrane protein YfcA